jgi:hypothetical protein
MTSLGHAGLGAGRWRTLTLVEQLGNIGSEVGRTVRAADEPTRQAAAARALELLDLTLADRRWYGRGSEIARAREVFCDWFSGANAYRTDPSALERYFTQFALAARLNR